MNINNQCCSWEQAERLRDFGVTQAGYFTFHEVVVNDDRSVPIIHRPNTGEYDEAGGDDINFPEELNGEEYETGNSASAFTAAELGTMLPHYTQTWDTGDIWKCKVMVVMHDAKIVGEGETQAKAMADLLIKFLETATIRIEAVNIRYSRW